MSLLIYLSRCIMTLQHVCIVFVFASSLISLCWHRCETWLFVFTSVRTKRYRNMLWKCTPLATQSATCVAPMCNTK